MALRCCGRPARRVALAALAAALALLLLLLLLARPWARPHATPADAAGWVRHLVRQPDVEVILAAMNASPVPVAQGQEYRVYPALRPLKSEVEGHVEGFSTTLCTQTSLSNLLQLTTAAAAFAGGRWALGAAAASALCLTMAGVGPVSVAVFAASGDPRLALLVMLKLQRCNPTALARTTMTLVVPVVPRLDPADALTVADRARLLASTRCAELQHELEAWLPLQANYASAVPYPNNFLRNVARDHGAWRLCVCVCVCVCVFAC